MVNATLACQRARLALSIQAPLAGWTDIPGKNVDSNTDSGKCGKDTETVVFRQRQENVVEIAYLFYEAW